MNGRWLLDRFLDRATAEPHAPAIEDGPRTVSYDTLRARTAEIADGLSQAADGGPVRFVVSTDDRAVVAAAVLATVAAGHTCALLDTDLPPPRRRAVFAAVTPDAVIGADGTVAPAAETALEADSGASRVADGACAAEDDGRFVFFTSGTTGRPKGVVSSATAVAHFVAWEADEVAAAPGTRFSQLTSPGYDAILRDLVVPLVTGGTVCVPPTHRAPTGEALADWLRSGRIEVLHCVPSLLRTLRRVALAAEDLSDLHEVLVAGEVLRPADVAWWHGIFGGRVGLMNLYGPSETLMTKIFHRTSVDDADRDVVPVGRPLPGVRARVLGPSGEELPEGRIGEVEIETPFPLGGYLDGPGSAFTCGDDGVLTRYRTGDQGRVGDDGRLEVLGRLDHQIKLHGVRIEPGDVERALLSHPQVLDAVVTVHGDEGAERLCAHVATAERPDTAALRRHVAGLLPPSIVPTVVVPVRELPRGLNGKVDRTALPWPTVSAAPGAPPRTAAEAEVAAAFADHLGLSSVARHDSLFDLGGTSLTALQVLDTLRVGQGVDVPIEVLFAAPTPEAIGRYIETNGVAP